MDLPTISGLDFFNKLLGVISPLTSPLSLWLVLSLPAISKDFNVYLPWERGYNLWNKGQPILKGLVPFHANTSALCVLCETSIGKMGHKCLFIPDRELRIDQSNNFTQV